MKTAISSRIEQSAHGSYLALLVVLAIFLAMFPQFSGKYLIVLFTELFIYTIFATSLNLLVGFTGLPSLGHAAFYAMGGYAVAILTTKCDFQNFWLCMFVALLSAGIVSSIFGFLSVRLIGVFFLMITLALAQVVWSLSWSWHSLSGGDDGLPGISRPGVGLPVSASSEISFYYLVLIFSIFAMFILYRICNSPFGYVLQGIRENETRMAALGYNTWKYKYVAFILAGIFAGLAGSLKAYQDGIVNPLYASITTSGIVFLMVLAGGRKVFIGPIIGAPLVWIVKSVVSSYTAEYWSLIMGILVVITVMLTPQGIGAYAVQVLRRGCSYLRSKH